MSVCEIVLFVLSKLYVSKLNSCTSSLVAFLTLTHPFGVKPNVVILCREISYSWFQKYI